MTKYKTVQISFNLSDPYQKKLYNYFKGQGKNSSLYGKMLIDNDMKRNVVEPDKANLLEPELVTIIEDPEIKINMDSAFKLK